MKLSKIIVIISLFVLSFGFVACQDQVLNKNPKNVYSSKALWNSPNLAESYLNKVYQGVGQFGIRHGNSPREMPSSATDEAMQRGNHGIWTLNKGNISPSNLGDFNIWSPDYKEIRRANVFLKNIDDVPGLSASKIKTMKAEAKFIRAKLYANLVNWYSWWQGPHNGVPLVTKPLKTSSNFKGMQRASYSDIVNFIVKECDAAAKNLPNKWPADQWGHITKGAALALKSEILLYAASKRHNPSMDQSKWKKAADAAKAVIDMGQYHLKSVQTAEDYAGIFLNGGTHPGIILARPYDPQHLSHYWMDKMNSPNGYLGWGGNCPNQGFVDKYEMKNGMKITNPNSGYDPQHPYENREIRFKGDVLYNNRMYRGRKTQFYDGGLDSKSGPQGWNTSPTGYTLYKFIDPNTNFHKTASPTPYIIYRIAEIYLNYAEAEYHLGNESMARKYVNKVRERVHLPDITSTGNQLLQDIRHERTIELAFERNFRWCDVRRWEIAPQTANKDYIKIDIKKLGPDKFSYSTSTAMPRTFNKRNYSLPIPLDEIQKTSLKQNPGY